MKTKKRFTTTAWGGLLALVLLLAGTSSHALDKAYSRQGIFTGVGLGGGVGIASGIQTMGVLGTSFELGIGATDKITIALRFDGALSINKDMRYGTLVPGPRVAFFLVKGLYLYAQSGLAMAFSSETDGAAAGFTAGAGLGFEHFVNTNLASYLALGGDYYLVNDDHTTNLGTITFWMGLRYY